MLNLLNKHSDEEMRKIRGAKGRTHGDKGEGCKSCVSFIQGFVEDILISTLCILQL